MKALQFSAIGDLAALRFVDVATPAPAASEVLVQIKAAGLNPSDAKNVLGRFPYTTLPRSPGRDFAGVVVQGPQELLGQEVWGTGRDLGFFADGSHAQYLTVSAKGVAQKPGHLSFAQAASLGVPYTTAWDALERSGVTKGTRLLVIGANGAVGSATLALANVRGAQVLAAVRRPEQADVLQTQGFEAIALGKPEELGAQVNAVFKGGRRCDLRHHRFLATGSRGRPGTVRSHRDHRGTGGRPCTTAGPGPVSQGRLSGGDQFVALQLRAVRGDAEAVRALF